MVKVTIEASSELAQVLNVSDDCWKKKSAINAVVRACRDVLGSHVSDYD